MPKHRFMPQLRPRFMLQRRLQFMHQPNPQFTPHQRHLPMHQSPPHTVRRQLVDKSVVLEFTECFFFHSEVILLYILQVVWQCVHHTASQLARKGHVWKRVPLAVPSSNVSLDSQSAATGIKWQSAVILSSAPEIIFVDLHSLLSCYFYLVLCFLTSLCSVSVYSCSKSQWWG